MIEAEVVVGPILGNWFGSVIYDTIIYHNTSINVYQNINIIRNNLASRPLFPNTFHTGIRVLCRRSSSRVTRGATCTSL